MSEPKIYKPRPVSGFPEWLPEVRRVELMWLDHIRRVFESYGFCSVETPAVEELDVINAKGGDGGADVDKEVYVLERLHKQEGDKEARLALHFDQTVPLARYVAQHFNDLTFPFKRYQMQKVWRGERPQAGRFREFYQCDIDVINVDALPLSFDAEMPAIIWEILSSLPGMENEKIQLRVSNRKILLGLFESWQIKDKTALLLVIDKKDKISADSFRDQAEKIFLKSGSNHAGASLRCDILIDALSLKYKTSAEMVLQIKNLTENYDNNSLALEGFKELGVVLDSLSYLKENLVGDLSIVRGLDYYTGTVYETVFLDNPEYGSICSGGRYDDLASNYINKKLPGVGISIGFSRLFAKLLEEKKSDETPKLPIGPKSPADLLMVIPSEERRALASETARGLRARGFNVELYHSDAKVKKQMEYASKKKIPYVWFPPFEDGSNHEVKNMTTGEQTKTDPASWKP